MSSLSEACIYDWDVERMVMWLREESLHDCVVPFSLKKINGLRFLNLSDREIKGLRISQESQRKLAKVLKRIKGKKNAVSKRFDGETSVIKERKKPSAVPVHVEEDESDHEGWCTDEFSDDADEEEEEEESDRDDSGGEYIEPEADDTFNPPQGSPSKEVPKVPLGLVAQLKAGLNGTIPRNPWMGPPENPHTKTTPSPFEDEEDQIYDEPPDGEDEVYEQPSDDSGSGIVVRPMSHKKIIRCESDKGEYIDARPPKYSDQGGTVDAPPPRRPPKPGSLKAKKVPFTPPAPILDQEIYDEVPEDEELGRTQIVEPEQETYEVPDDGTQDNAIPQQEQETYEVPDQPDEPETYEVPEEPETYEVPEEQAPARPPPRKAVGGPGLKPPPKASLPQPQPEKKKVPSPKDVPKPKPAVKPAITPKPHISPKPSPPAPAPAVTAGRTSRLYPAPKDNTVSPEPPSIKRLSGLPPPGSRPPIPPPSQESPTKTEKNNNEFPSRIQLPQGRRAVPPPAEESPPPPPRPGIKPPPIKPPRLPSESDNQDDAPSLPGRPLPGMKQRSPLPVPPEPKSVDPLKQFPWFHGPLDKKIAENALKSFSKEGAFIVRNSSKDPNNYSMSLFSKGSVKHLRMPRDPTNNKFVLGDSGKVQFSSIPELVNYYSQHHVELKSGSSTSLTAACPVRL